MPVLQRRPKVGTAQPARGSVLAQLVAHAEATKRERERNRAAEERATRVQEQRAQNALLAREAEPVREAGKPDAYPSAIVSAIRAALLSGATVRTVFDMRSIDYPDDHVGPARLNETRIVSYEGQRSSLPGNHNDGVMRANDGDIVVHARRSGADRGVVTGRVTSVKQVPHRDPAKGHPMFEFTVVRESVTVPVVYNDVKRDVWDYLGLPEPDDYVNGSRKKAGIYEHVLKRA
jgi:hypothetical protein